MKSTEEFIAEFTRVCPACETAQLDFGQVICEECESEEEHYSPYDSWDSSYD